MQQGSFRCPLTAATWLAWNAQKHEAKQQQQPRSFMNEHLGSSASRRRQQIRAHISFCNDKIVHLSINVSSTKQTSSSGSSCIEACSLVSRDSGPASTIWKASFYLLVRPLFGEIHSKACMTRPTQQICTTKKHPADLILQTIFLGVRYHKILVCKTTAVPTVSQIYCKIFAMGRHFNTLCSYV